jgi:hypothetical protein
MGWNQMWIQETESIGVGSARKRLPKPVELQELIGICTIHVEREFDCSTLSG